jgi:hypothetical protein
MISHREYSSTADLIAGAAEIKQRLFAPRPAVVSVPAAKPIVEPDRRRFQVKPITAYDAHLLAFVEWRSNPPLGFLKMRCRELDVSYADIVGPKRTADIANIRHSLIAEVKDKFPHLSNHIVGKLFGGRDHTTVLASIWRATGVKRSRDKPNAAA